MSVHYKNPPLYEVVCEMHFAKEVELPPIEILKEKLQAKFPNYKEHKVYQLGFNITEKSVSPEQEIEVGKRHIFTTFNEKIYLQIDSTAIVLNRLRPYDKWENLLPHLEYVDSEILPLITDYKFKNYKLRYINHIEIPKSDLGSNLNLSVIKRYFGFYPQINKTEEKEIKAFISGIEEYDDENNIIKSQLQTSLSKAADKQAFTFEISNYLNTSLDVDEISKLNLINWFESAHKRIVGIFEGTVTDELREYWD